MQRKRRNGWWLPGCLAAAGLALPLASCVPAHRRAPVVQQVIEFTPGPTADAATLERGRTIYTTNCTECHHVEPIEKWSEREWREEILPEMFEEAELNQTQRSDLEAYIIAAHAALERIPK